MKSGATKPEPKLLPIAYDPGENCSAVSKQARQPLYTGPGSGSSQELFYSLEVSAELCLLGAEG